LNENSAYYLVFDGLADWEAALALAEINKSERYTTTAVGLTSEPVVTAAGLRIQPDGSLDTLDDERAAAFVVPGGDFWEQEDGDKAVVEEMRRLHAAGVLVAAICGGTLVAARAGLLENRRHTSNMPGYIEQFVPGYNGNSSYVSEEMAVMEDRLITASGVGGVEFARELLRALQVYDEDELESWFGLFKHGIVPDKYT
jgi:putative intracellular protease/amidase